MSDNADEITGLFNEGVFNSIEVIISIMNATTRTEFKKQPVTSLLEITEEGLVLEAPSKCCASKHSLLLTIKGSAPGGESIQFTVTARVNTIESTQDGMERLELSLIQVHEDDWDKFKKLFSARQDEINDFLKASRGF